MPLLDLGRDLIADAIIGGATYNKFNNTNARLGVGDSATAFSASQTDLVGSNKTRKPMEATYPLRAANAITWRSVFGTGDANYAWQERIVANSASGPEVLMRRVVSLGTKTGSSTWQLTATDTIVHA